MEGPAKWLGLLLCAGCGAIVRRYSDERGPGANKQP
jgi:hypothetical protein